MSSVDANSQRSSGFAATSTVVLVTDVCGLLVVGALFVGAIPKFCKMFAEMGMALPVVTQIVISVPGAGYAAIFLLLLAAIIAKELLIRDRRITLAINVIAGLAGMVWLFVVVFALFSPMMTLMTNIR
ncbi:MAG TPA: hypothetical protein VM223_02025 [Planctomycetota bacterium]|nr:hypothetical protein [Planctomycetota bacterium]